MPELVTPRIEKKKNFDFIRDPRICYEECGIYKSIKSKLIQCNLCDRFFHKACASFYDDKLRRRFKAKKHAIDFFWRCEMCKKIWKRLVLMNANPLTDGSKDDIRIVEESNDVEIYEESEKFDIMRSNQRGPNLPSECSSESPDLILQGLQMAPRENSEKTFACIVRDLETAVSKNDDERIKELFKTNAGLLHYAAKENLSKIVREMIKCGANVNAPDSAGVTPLHVAAQYASKETVSILLQNGAMYDAVDDLETKAIDVAKDEEISSVLRSTEALFVSVLRNNLAEVQRSFKEGAFLEARNSEGNTALHNAVRKGFEKIAKILLDYNADVNARCCEGLTPLHYAVKKSHVNIVELLLFRGAFFDAVDDHGKTPSDLCVKEVLSQLFTLIRACFHKIQSDDDTVISDIRVIDSFGTKKAVLGAKNNEGNTLTVEAILRKFSKLEEFKKKLQTHVYDDVKSGIDSLDKDKLHTALKTLQSAWKKRKRLLGPDNPFTLEVQFHIARVLKGLGRFQECSLIVGRVCEKQTEMFGYDAAETLASRSLIASVMQKLGKEGEAIEQLKLINKIRDELCGSDDDVNLLYRRALFLEAQHKHKQVANLYMSIWNDFKTKLPHSESRRTLVALNTYAMYLFRQGKYECCLEKLITVLTNRVMVLGSDDSDTVKTLVDIDIVLAKMGIGPNNASEAYKGILNVRLNMAQKLRDQNKPLNAMKVIRDGLEPLKAVYGVNHWKVLNCIQTLKKMSKKLASEGIYESQVLENNEKGFMDAVVNGNLDDVNFFLNQDGCPDINAKDGEGRTPLHFAVGNGHLKIVEALIARGADVTLATVDGRTPLHAATTNGSMDILKVLLCRAMSLGLDKYVDAQTALNATTALHVAAKNGQLEIVKLLLAHGVTFEIANKDGKKPVDLATDEKVRGLLILIKELFECIEQGDLMVTVLKLDPLSPDELFPVVRARNLEGAFLMKMAVHFERQGIVDLLNRKAGEPNEYVAEIYF